MFKLVVLLLVGLIAAIAAAPSPGYLGGYALPAATSYTSRIDVHAKPLITTYAAAPVVTKTVIAAVPAAVAYAPVQTIDHGYAAAPILSGYSGYGLGHGYGYGGYGHGW